MELFPIIYTSLLVAAGLFVLTVIISYISYKLKQDKPGIESAHSVSANKQAYPGKEKRPEFKKVISPEEEPTASGKQIPDNERKTSKKKTDLEKYPSNKPIKNNGGKEQTGIENSSSNDNRIKIVKDLGHANKSGHVAQKSNLTEEIKKKKSIMA